MAMVTDRAITESGRRAARIRASVAERAEEPDVADEPGDTVGGSTSAGMTATGGGAMAAGATTSDHAPSKRQRCA